jgi:hypothetical protein
MGSLNRTVTDLAVRASGSRSSLLLQVRVTPITSWRHRSDRNTSRGGRTLVSTTNRPAGVHADVLARGSQQNTPW